MKLLLILTASIISLSVIAQDNRKHKILIGYSFSSDYSYRTLSCNDGSSSGSVVIKSRNDIEVAKFGYATGFNILFNTTQLLGIETGIQFSNKGYRTKDMDLNYAIPEPGSPIKAKIIYSYQYIGIPVKARFSFGKEKVRFTSSVGFVTNFLLQVRQVNNYEYAGGKNEKKHNTLSGYKTVDISPIVSVGIDYKLNNKTHLLAEPTFRYGILKTMEAPVKENLWSAGLNVGIYRAIK